MGRLIRCELNKILGRKLFFGILITLQLANLLLLGLMHRPTDFRPPLRAYAALRTELAALPNAQRPAWIAQYDADVQGVQRVERVRLYEAWQTEEGRRLAQTLIDQNPQAYARYLQMEQNGNALRYSKNLQQEAALAKQVHAEMEMLADYPNFLTQIRQRSDALAQISIFDKTVGGGFSSRNIQKTAADYAALSEVEIKYDVSYGVGAAVSALTTDCLVFVFLFFFAFLTIEDEKNKGLFALVKATPRGQTQTITAKMAVLALCSAFVVLYLYGGNLIFFHRTVGLGDLSRSLQSAAQFMGSTLRLSVGGFLAGFLALKALTCFLIGLGVMLAAQGTRRSASAFLMSGTALGVSFLLYTLIPFNSPWTILKMINLFGLFRAQDILGLYLNLNVLGYPVSLLAAGLVTIAALILILAGLNLRFFKGGAKPVSSFRPGVKRLSCAKHAGKSLMRHELFKILGINKAAVVLVGWLGLAMIRAAEPSVYLSPEELMYRQAISQLAGPVTAEKQRWIAAEQKRFLEAENELEQLTEQAASGSFSQAQAQARQESLNRMLAQKPAFDRVKAQVENARENQGWIVYETGYLALLQKEYSSEMLLMCLMLIAVCSFIFPMDYGSGMDQLIQATPRGRRDLDKVKRRIAYGMTGLIAVAGMLPDIIAVVSSYGLPLLDAPLRSLADYAALPTGISIGGFLIIIGMLKLLACFAVTSFILILSRKIRHGVYTLLISTLIIALPILLSAMGLEWCGNFGFVLLFNAGIDLAGNPSAQGLIACGLALALIAADILDKKQCL